MTTTVKVNGEAAQLTRAKVVADALRELGYTDPFVAVALNRACVRRKDFATTPVNDGDEIEILAPMAGG